MATGSAGQSCSESVFLLLDGGATIASLAVVVVILVKYLDLNVLHIARNISRQGREVAEQSAILNAGKAEYSFGAEKDEFMT